MPRLVDETKLIRIKDAAIELIVSNGYGGASISSIAKKAEVAEGYLYRYYNSKQDLIEDLLFTRLKVLIEKLEHLIEICDTVSEIIERLFIRFFDLAKKNPEHIKFIHVLMHDYNFQVEDRQRKTIKSLCSKVLLKGKETKEICPKKTEEEIYLIAVTYPLEFINMRMKNFFNKNSCTKTDISRLTNFCINTLNQS
ncbi:MAG: TetR/AcrR family transcriptional regulator [Bacteroidales bacterium]|nr:TetR/AcrR family transcriptional regulator [Bacteroidales bacterium]